MPIQAIAYIRNHEGIVVTNANSLNSRSFDEHEVLFTAPTYGDALLLRKRLGWDDNQDTHSQYGRAKHAARGHGYRAIIAAGPLESESYDELAPCLFEGEALEGRHFRKTVIPEPERVAFRTSRDRIIDLFDYYTAEVTGSHEAAAALVLATVMNQAEDD